MNRKTPKKKKFFLMMNPVKDFMRNQPVEVKRELNGIVWKLETNGILEMPYGEKVIGEELFAIRIIHAANIRIFYVYGRSDVVFGIHAYTKKTQDIPEKEKKQARKVLKQLIEGGFIK